MLVHFFACRVATTVNWCVENPGECATCETDGDCAYSGNPCTETVYCAHDAAEIAVVQIGCDAAIEYAWPDDATCACSAGVCRSGE